MSKVITGIGEILWDLLPSGKNLGGAPANFAYLSYIWHAVSTAVMKISDALTSIFEVFSSKPAVLYKLNKS